MSLIKYILIFVICGNLNAATDRAISLAYLGKDGSSDNFRDNLNDLQSDVSYYNTGRNVMKGFIYVGRESFNFLLDLPAVQELSGPARRVVNWTADLGNLAVDWAMDYQIQEGARGAIYKAWVADRARIETAFRVTDHVERTKKVYDVLNEMDAFGYKLGEDRLSTDERAILNSRMILRLSVVTKEITFNTLQNTQEIDKLKASGEKYKQFLRSKFPDFQNFLKLEGERQELYQEFNEGSGRAARRIASVMENNTPEDIRSGTISEADKVTLKETMAEVADTMAKAEEYLSKSAIIANNLLKGKDLERANKAIFYASNGVKVIGGIAKAYSGDPMGAMDAMVGISNLIGGNSKPSPEALRHQAVMKAFGQVFANQRKIIKNQERMFKLQVKTYKLLANLHKLTRQNFRYLNERIDVMLGNQAALLGNVVEFSDVKENLNYCKDFLNSRFKCRPEFLESNGDILKCISQVKNQKEVGDYRDTFVPVEQPMSTVLVQGGYSDYSKMLEHFNVGQNKTGFKKCYSGLKTLLGHDLHPLFLSRTYPKEGSFTSYNDDFLFPVYKPLMELAGKYFMSNEKSANSFYKALLIPHKDFTALSQKSQRMMTLFTDVDEYELLTQTQIKDGLTSHVYVPALDHYLSAFTEMSSYWDLVEGNVSNNFNLVSYDGFGGLMNTSGSQDLNKYYRKLVKVVEIAIAQQNLLSGDILIPFIRNIAKRGKRHPDFLTAEKAVKNNQYLARNLFVYSLTKAFDSKSNPKKYYDSYRNYRVNGLGGCSWDNSKKSYGSGCKLKFLMEVSLPFVFKPNGIFLRDSETAKVNPVTTESLKEKQLVFSPHFYRTMKLKNQLYSRMANFKGVTKAALDDNLYVLQ
ncbi:MAG: hypothetical protein KC478_15225 [Bacteriovoracaceae bacterium]|nr:hypothetical protein [Bacteriovoracaceae bacterium]